MVQHHAIGVNPDAATYLVQVSDGVDEECCIQGEECNNRSDSINGNPVHS